MISAFLYLPMKSPAVSACSGVDFFFILGGRRDFYNFPSNEKIPGRFMSQGSGHKFGGEAYILPGEIAELIRTLIKEFNSADIVRLPSTRFFTYQQFISGLLRRLRPTGSNNGSRFNL
jgi:hypothetical protein